MCVPIEVGLGGGYAVYLLGDIFAYYGCLGTVGRGIGDGASDEGFRGGGGSCFYVVSYAIVTGDLTCCLVTGEYIGRHVRPFIWL